MFGNETEQTRSENVLCVPVQGMGRTYDLEVFFSRGVLFSRWTIGIRGLPDAD